MKVGKDSLPFLKVGSSRFNTKSQLRAQKVNFEKKKTRKGGEM